MIYGSVCSGIEAATVAWHPLGWKPAFFSEIEKFPSAVLAHHYQDVPNLGDMTKFKEWPDANLDVLVGGTPCQSFSVAGLRKGLDDPRGNLMLTYLAIADRYRPKWLVWENVPGVLSSNGGRDFGTFLGALGKLGYGFAYRVLDAQYFGVAQRRRRVFVVGCLGDWRAAAAVLFERESLSGNPAPSRETRQEVAGAIAKCFGIRGANTSSNGWGISEELTHTLDQAGPHTVAALTANGVGTCGADDNHGQAGHILAAYGGGNCSGAIDTSTALTAHGTRQDFDTETFVAHSTGAGVWQSGFGTLRAREQESHEHLIASSTKDHGADATEDCCPTLRAGGNNGSQANSGNWPAVAFAENSRNEVRLEGGDGSRTGALSTGGGKAVQGVPCVAIQEVGKRTGVSTDDKRCGIGISEEGDPMFTLQAGAQHGVIQSVADTLTSHWHNSNDAKAGNNAGMINPVINRMAVRRLTPVECERLQGFPDNYTRIPWRNKPAEDCPDGPRYKALGNSMAVPVMRWLGERIEMVEKVIKEAAA